MSQEQAAPEGAEASLRHSSSFDLLRKRLAEQAKALLEKASALNDARLAEFGREEMALRARTRARTDNNCTARDLVLVGDVLLFGYNVFIGLRQETQVADVFALYRLRQHGGEVELDPLALDGSFLAEPRFVAEFKELYNYYRNAQLVQLRVTQGKLLAAFKIGERLSDLRVFRWQLDEQGAATYIDNRGERDIALPPPHDFEWTVTTRDQHVLGQHPHVNVLDTLFVETVGGDLTVKIENNTETGLGIYSEPVDDPNQSLSDAEIAYASLGDLILLRIRPYRETQQRYLVYSRLSQQAQRVDSIGASCVQLPEDHGIVFPGGVILQGGESRLFSGLPEGLQFERRVLAPNGEDVLYVFYEVVSGTYVLLTYNLINKTLSQPLVAHGYARYDDGSLLLFTAESEEPTRNHPMQWWQTPFLSDEFAAGAAPRQGFFGKIGNRELVRGVSELYSIGRMVREQGAAGDDALPGRAVYESLLRQCRRVADAFHWLGAPEARGVGADLAGVSEMASATMDEFDKVAAIQRETARVLQQTAQEQRQLLAETASRLWQSPTEFIEALEQIRLARGRLATLQERRYMDVARLAELDSELGAEEARVGERTVQFLSQANAFARLEAELAKQREQLPQLGTTAELAPLNEALDRTARNLDGLNELLGSLAVGDATLRTQILTAISRLYAGVNQLRAEVRQRRKQLSQAESASEFAAQFQLFSQSVESSLEQADTPERCDDMLTRLLAQLETLEGQFAEQEDYLAEIAHKREAVYEAMEGRKQSLLDARARRVQAIGEAARRILAGVPKRLAQFSEPAQMEAYFASDALLGKLKASIEELRKLGNAVAADDLSGQLKNLREQGQRALRDQNELVSGNVIKLGRHDFTVNRQTLELAIVPHQGELAFHLAGTDYYAPLRDERLEALRPWWSQETVAETGQVYRGEYLAYQFMRAVRAGTAGIDWQQLQAALAQPDGAVLDEQVRRFAAPRYQEGYQKGQHDYDAAAILRQLVPLWDGAGLLRFSPLARAVALLYWTHVHASPAAQSLRHQAEQAELMRRHFNSERLWDKLAAEAEQALKRFLDAELPDIEVWLDHGSETRALLLAQAARYLLSELGVPASAEQAWLLSRSGSELANGLTQHLARHTIAAPWEVPALSWRERWMLATEWLHGYANQHGHELSLLPEAAASLLSTLPRRVVQASVEAQVTGLLGEHARIEHRTLKLQLNDFLRRLEHHEAVVVPAFRSLQQLRQQLAQEENARLRLDQFQAKPLSSFFRNRLIDEAYLPLVGDNLAKQIGAAGNQRRVDSMGMLLLISPPGYGKTTLMEYLGERLGMIFVRINCPVLGHGVTSLDPALASNSAARMELEKLNLGLAMGNNVMLYLDDIQHTNPEFLQKFIALADGTRRIEGVWRGESRSYDLRGKRFAVVMAGNPYTESGDVFKIPDMLANRADIYNLGDVLSGREELFALSYIENALVAHPELQPLASRDPHDLYLLVRMAQGEPVAASELKHAYTSQEIDQICAVLQRLFKVRNALMKVNLAYIASAAQDDAYRAEPPFKLQGSYRNMAKLAPKVSALMHDVELDALLRDHYRGEAQTLTTGAEENLLRLAHLLGQPTDAEQARWNELVDEFVRLRKNGGQAEGETRVADHLAEIGAGIAALGCRMAPQVAVHVPEQERLNELLQRLADSYEKVLLPMMSAMNYKMRLDHGIWDEVRATSSIVKDMEHRLRYRGKKGPPPPKQPREPAGEPSAE